MYENKVRAREFDSPGLVYGFFAGTGMLTIALCLMIASLFLTGCGKGSPTTPPLPPNPDDYEPLGVVHILKDAQGKDTGVWARLTAEPAPPRGSTYTPSPGSPSGSVSIPIEDGCNGKKAPGGAMIVTYLSRDGASEDMVIGATAVGPDRTVAGVAGGWPTFVPKYVIQKATVGFGKNKKTGVTTFLLDYR